MAAGLGQGRICLKLQMPVSLLSPMRKTIIVPSRFAALVSASVILSACGPPKGAGTGPGTSRNETTTGTATTEGGTTATAQASLFKPLQGATYVAPKPPAIDESSTGAMEFRSPAHPAGANLPYPDAYLVDDIEPGKRGGNFTYCTISDPKTFNPITANENSSTDLTLRMFAGLVDIDYVTQGFELGMLKEMVMENGDASTWLLRLRDGIKWSDGQPITADDIVFSYQVTMDEKIVTPAKDMLRVAGKPLEMEKVDNLTVRVRCAAPTGLFHVIIGTLVVVPKHTLEGEYKAGAFETAMNINVDPAKVVTSGPYKLKQFLTGEKTVLERNPHYFKYDKAGTQLPYLDTITFTVVPDQDAMLLRFKSKAADAISFPRMQDVFQLRDDQQKENYTLYDTGPAESISYLWLNQKPGTNKDGKPFIDPGKLELFSNREFRQACIYALNKDAVINSVLRGQAVSAWAEISPALTFWHNPNTQKYPYDVAKSKEVLDRLEMKDRDGDGIRETTSGVKLSFTFITNKGNKSREEIATLLSADLKAVGIQATPQYMDFPALVTKLNDTFDYEGCYLGFGGSIHPISSMNSYRSSGRTHFWNPLQATPATPWEAEIDRLCDQFVVALSPTEQRRLIHQVQQIISEQAPTFPLFVNKAFHAVRNTYGNLKPVGISEIFWNAEEIYAKQ